MALPQQEQKAGQQKADIVGKETKGRIMVLFSEIRQYRRGFFDIRSQKKIQKPGRQIKKKQEIQTGVDTEIIKNAHAFIDEQKDAEQNTNQRQRMKTADKPDFVFHCRYIRLCIFLYWWYCAFRHGGSFLCYGIRCQIFQQAACF